MSLNIKLKRSAVLGSVPTSTQLEDGEIGVNYNVDDPAIYLKDSSGAVVRIAGEDSIGTYWDRSGNTTVSPSVAGDNVEIGGGNIKLNAAGTGLFGSQPYQGAGSGVYIINSGLIRAGNTSGTPVWQGYKVGTTDPTSQITSNGVGTFAGDLLVPNTINTATTDNGIHIYAGGQIYASRAGSNSLWTGKQTAVSGYTSRINADGSAEFAGPVLIGGTLPSLPNTTLNADGTANFGGDVGIGTDNPLSRLHISGGFNSHIRQTNTSDDALDHLADANRGSSEQTILSTKGLWAGTAVASINFNTGDDAVNKDNGYILFRTANSGGNLVNRATISEGGVASFKSNTALQAEFGVVRGDYRNGENYTRIYGSGATNYVQTKACTNADNTAAFDITIGSSQQAVIRADGDMENANGTYGQLSDERLKENIEDAPSQWEDVKETKVRSFNFKEATGYSTHKQIGWVAQEVELISPGCVSETEPEEGEEPKKSVKSSVMLIKAYKALQEAMERIETLEERLAALESSASA